MAELITKLGSRIPVSDKSKRIKKLTEFAAPLSQEHIRQAAAEFNFMDGRFASFKDSTDFDVIIDDQRYPPKAILGIALSEYHGVNILPEHFSGGEKSSCFRILNNLGFRTAEKEGATPKRESELFNYSNFRVGMAYTKLEAFEQGGVVVPKQARDIPGPTRFNNCVVLFVTLEKDNKENAHKYNDKFLIGGRVFHWESQNKNTPETPHMKMIIEGEPVVLFARVQEKIKGKSQPFIYVGRLEYLEHSYPKDSKNIPVEVISEVLDYQSHADEALSALYEWEPSIDGQDKPIDVSKTVLTQAKVPSSSTKVPRQYRNSNRNTKTNWAERDEHNRNLGYAGEKLVVQHEKQTLTELGRPDLAKRVEHIAEKSDGCGYDVLSFDRYGIEKYIEVKTTKQSKGTAFFISKNEVKVSQQKNEQYWIYRVFDLRGNSASFYALQGPVDEHFNLTAESYKASPK
ncbi:DUF3427 domain-containing protein [Enterovibrio norvegicus]|uniref:DUF3427 domain-containing protein n=1 Tax=Enterovibrio norvegicus TaxID=188144 RepID=UPI0002F4C65C|nr:DUF3427 domain-containing protein [Enterovibrio norvegicus]OEF57980.1 hypothetical protein A1OU_07170 [Enterovibrio norvegicus]